MNVIKITILVLITSLTLFILTGCKDNTDPTHTATIEMNNGDIITLELYGGIAPITVDNFADLANEGFYDGLIFHRVIENFMIQGGDPQGTGAGGSGNTIKGEFSSNNVDNPISHERGVLSMARSNDKDSASSQFFIVHKDSKFLDGDYAAFGRVIDGMSTVDQIAAAQTNTSDKPINNQVIKSIRVVEN